KQLDKLARESLTPFKDDPHLLGYFTDNELGWWDDTLFLYYLKQPAHNVTRRVLLRLLREHYSDDFARLQRDFDTGSARSFEALERDARLTLKPGGRGMAVINKFTFKLAERYYRLMHDTIRRYDKHHLILGDRYHDFYPQAVARAARRYVDVISTNHGADWTDGANARFYFDTLHRLTGKPILVTEFYFCAMENRSGNKNRYENNPQGITNFPTVLTQRERAEGFRNNLTALASLPYVVGAHWFQYYDEPTHGRGDGENFNMGLVDIHDRPYEELTATAASLNLTDLHRCSHPEPRPLRIPPAPANPTAGLRVWDKARAFVSSATKFPFADLYACWEAHTLYLALYAMDYVDENLYAGGIIPESERMEWTIHLSGGRKPLRIRFGPGGKATFEGTAVPCHEWSGWTRFTVLVELPASLLGKDRLRAGDSYRLRATLSSHSRAEHMKWDQTLYFDAP
ncbi:MAG: hypothetical protein NZT92_07310, partial [Abditibacteriales bacterium]|nr:hypothetical protein [Abditibacteriales bacterium]MDW8365400.1 hypothetical protein [Abditibacteriales bacterium]